MIKALEKEIKKNSEIKSFLKKLKDGKATSSDVSLYAANLGECIGKIINRNINKKISWDELNALSMPLFKEAHEKVYVAASIVQAQEDNKSNIGLKPIKPEFPELKIHDLIYKIYSTLKEQENGN